MKLTQEAATALVRLRSSEDFAVFLKWMKEHEAQAIQACCTHVDPNSIYRQQGRVGVFQDLTKAVAEAPSVLAKLNQSNR